MLPIKLEEVREDSNITESELVAEVAFNGDIEIVKHVSRQRLHARMESRLHSKDFSNTTNLWNTVCTKIHLTSSSETNQWRYEWSLAKRETERKGVSDTTRRILFQGSNTVQSLKGSMDSNKLDVIETTCRAK